MQSDASTSCEKRSLDAAFINKLKVVEVTNGEAARLVGVRVTNKLFMIPNEELVTICWRTTHSNSAYVMITCTT